MDSIALWSAVAGCLANLILLITHLVQMLKLQKEMKDVKIIVNNTSELKQSLNKPFEGSWEVRGIYSRYHDIEGVFNCAGFVNFLWNDSQKKYEVYYVYSVRKQQDLSDLVTAYCKGSATCNEEGNVDKDGKIHLLMTVINRSATDQFINLSNTFELVSSKITKTLNKYNEIEFSFKNIKSEGTIKFVR